MARKQNLPAGRQVYWKTNIKLFLLIVGGIFFIALVFKTLQIVKNSSFDGQSRFTIILSGQKVESDILVFSVEPKKKSISAVIIPSHYKKEGGGKLLAREVRDLLGIGVDGWAVTKVQGSGFRVWGLGREANAEIHDGLSIQKALLFLKNGGFAELDTNLTIIDIVRLWYEATNISIDKIEVAQMTSAEPRLIDKTMAVLFINSRLLAEGRTVEVINGTEVGGLGASIARIAANLGAQVLLVKSSQEKMVTSGIFVKQESFTAKKLGQVFSLPIKVDKRHDFTSDIQIVIGEDYLR